jgi:hypothetical protein
MMNIDDSNPVIKNFIYKNLTSSIKSQKFIDEFGYYKYAIYSELSENASKNLVKLNF